MTAHVLIQVVLLNCGIFTECAVERPIIFMKSQMSLQIALECECLSTLGIVEMFFSSMSMTSHVNNEIAFLDEGLWAVFAFKGSVASVEGYVVHQLFISLESFAFMLCR